MLQRSLVYLIMVTCVLKFVDSSANLYDEDLYQSILDNVTCQRHLEQMDHFQLQCQKVVEFLRLQRNVYIVDFRYIDWFIRKYDSTKVALVDRSDTDSLNVNVTVGIVFDASGRIPQSITLGGQGSLGNYHQCLSIAQEIANDTIEGKYCMIGVPLMQTWLKPPALDPEANLDLNGTFFELINMGDNNSTDIRNGWMLKSAVGIMMGNGITRAMSNTQQGGLAVKVAVCIPRSCTTLQAFGQYIDMLNLTYNDLYCRLPDDKIFSAVDYVAIVVIAILGMLTTLSTIYDLYSTFLIGKAPAETSKFLTCFSIFTNTRRLMTFPKTSGSIDCLDGLRSLSILWVVIGHSFSNVFAGTTINLLTAYKWAYSSKAIWLLSAFLSVDTFFMMSGLLVVHTTVKKMEPISLVKNIHLFYLHRLLRMFPLLAAVVLFQASLIHHSADGPQWPALASSVNNCREWWWSTLLHVQNYVNINEICLGHTWYLSVDTQLHMLSPVVLFWVLRGRRSARLGLAGGLLVSIVVTTSYCYVNSFAGVSPLGIGGDIRAILHYFKYYYVNTLTRSPPFVVGMLYGYLLHVSGESLRRISKWLIAAGWFTALLLLSGTIYCNNPTLEFSPFWTNFLNSFMRGFWALAVGWVVFACALGYGGPINWFLSLKIWKFLARISYSLYLIHYPIQIVIRMQNDMPSMFSVRALIYLFYSDITLSLMVATALCVIVDAPFSTLQKILMSGKLKPSAPSNAVSSSSRVLVGN